MIIKLQQNNSEAKRFTKNISDVLSMNGSMRAESSIIDPVILIEGDITNLKSCNYMTIPEFGRSYFIRNIETVRNGLIQISGHVDVLSTYAEQILSNQAIVRRQENLWNLYLDDGVFKVYNNPTILTKAFPSGFSTMSFILAVAGS